MPQKSGFIAAVLTASIVSGVAHSSTVYQRLPYVEAWTDISRIVTSDDWSRVPGVMGYRGDGLTNDVGLLPWAIQAPGTSTPVSLLANRTSPESLATGGVAEFHLSDPTIALQGSTTADAPFILIHLDATDWRDLRVQYRVRDLEARGDDAVQPVTLQYRIGESGNFSNVIAGTLSDATVGPNVDPLDTLFMARLPERANDQPQLQLRIMTTNAPGNDEWVGIDDIRVGGLPIVSLQATIPPSAALHVAAVPEPGEWSLLLAGLGIMGAMVRRRRPA